MRKKNFAILLLILCAFIIGCQNNTIENKIKAAFKQYGNENFASKNSIKDYISIEPFDTISSQALIESCEVFVNAELPFFIFQREIESYGNKYDNVLRKTKVPYRLREQLNDAMEEMRANPYQGTYLILVQEKLKEVMNEVNSSDSIYIVQYKIKARIKENNITEVREYYAIVENNDYDNIKIQDHELKTNECPEIITKLISAMDTFTEIYKDEKKTYNRVLSLLAECGLYLD